MLNLTGQRIDSACCMLNFSSLNIGYMERHERIARAIAVSGKRKNEIAAACEVAASAVTQWVNGSSKSIKPENLYALAKATGFRAEWLAIGEGPERESSVEPGPPVSSPYREIKILGTAQMGTEGYWHALDEADGVVDVPSRDPGAYALRLKGDSMAPAIRSGWIAVCEPNGRLVPGEYVMIRLVDGESMLKELLYANEVEISVMSVNDAYGRRTIPIEQIDQIHYVGAIVPPSKIRV